MSSKRVVAAVGVLVGWSLACGPGTAAGPTPPAPEPVVAEVPPEPEPDSALTEPPPPSLGTDVATYAPFSGPGSLPTSDDCGQSRYGYVCPRHVAFSGTTFSGDLYTGNARELPAWLGVSLGCEGGLVDLPAVEITSGDALRHRYHLDVGQACNSLVAAVWTDQVDGCEYPEEDHPGCAAYGYGLEGCEASYPRRAFAQGEYTEFFVPLTGPDFHVQVLDGGAGATYTEGVAQELKAILAAVFAPTGRPFGVTTGTAENRREGHNEVLWRTDPAAGAIVSRELGCEMAPAMYRSPCEVRQWEDAPADVVLVLGHIEEPEF